MWWILATVISAILVVFSNTLETNVFELVGFITATICVWDAAHNRERNWAIGAISCVAFFVVFARINLWGNMTLQLIYLAQAVWGYFLWKHGGNRRGILRINGLPPLSVLQYALLFTVITSIVTVILTGLNGVAPFWDTVTAVLSIAANQMLVRRRVENWYLWLVVDAISVILFASQGLFFTTATYALYLVISLVKAVPVWRKEAIQ